MKLNKQVWHGYTREAGETVIFAGEGEATVTDSHGCASLWVRDSRGDLMSVWNCEVSE
jgi:hypothetical protein